MKTVVFSVDELECTSCANTVLKELSKRGFNNANVDIVEKTVTVDFDETTSSVADIEKALKAAGFGFEVLED